MIAANRGLMQGLFYILMLGIIWLVSTAYSIVTIFTTFQVTVMVSSIFSYYII